MSRREAPSGPIAATIVAAALAALFTARLALSVTVTPAAGREARAAIRPAPDGRAVEHVITGRVPAGADRLRLETALGGVRLRPAAGSDLVYRVTLRATGTDPADARRRLDRMVVSASRAGDLIHFTGALPGDPDAARGLAAEFEIEVPRAIGAIEVVTGAGDIEAAGASGRVALTTRGGAITASDIAGPLEAETRSGRIRLGAVRGAARLTSAGGGVLVESAGGRLVVRTSGGEVRIDHAGAEVEVESGGGSVRIGRAARGVRVATVGGSIEIGEAGGEVVAATAGGAIRVGSAAAVRCETAAGPIALGAVRGPIRAVSSAGNIRALLGPGVLAGDSDIRTFHGDVLVSLTDDLAVTIRALVDSPVGRAIHSDFPLAIQRDLGAVGRPLEIGEARLGGGGPLLKLRTLGGRIVIRNASHTPVAADARPRAIESTTEEP